MERNYTVDPHGVIYPPEKLKSCPCCGENARFNVGLTGYQIICSKCGVNIFGTNDKAICRKWNKRPKAETCEEAEKPKRKRATKI